MMNRKSAGEILGMALVMIALGVALPGCDSTDGTAEQAGEKLDNAAEHAGEQIEKAGDALQDAVKDDKN